MCDPAFAISDDSGGVAGYSEAEPKRLPFDTDEPRPHLARARQERLLTQLKEVRSERQWNSGRNRDSGGLQDRTLPDEYERGTR
jgi:hypothetical protein